MKTKSCGPIQVICDDQAETVSFAVRRDASTRTQLEPSVMKKVAAWALSVAEGFDDYEIDQTPIQVFLDWD